MKNTLIVFDLDISVTDTVFRDIKIGMKILGYFDYVTIKDSLRSYLPQAILWKPRTTFEEAMEDLQTVTAQYGARIDRLISFQFDKPEDLSTYNY